MNAEDKWNYLFAIFVVTFSMSTPSLPCPSIAILVIPGKSTRVRSGVCFEKILSTIGISTISFLEPATSSVSISIVFRTLSKL